MSAPALHHFSMKRSRLSRHDRASSAGRLGNAFGSLVVVFNRSSESHWPKKLLTESRLFGSASRRLASRSRPEGSASSPLRAASRSAPSGIELHRRYERREASS